MSLLDSPRAISPRISVSLSVRGFCVPFSSLRSDSGFDSWASKTSDPASLLASCINNGLPVDSASADIASSIELASADNATNAHAPVVAASSNFASEGASPRNNSFGGVISSRARVWSGSGGRSIIRTSASAAYPILPLTTEYFALRPSRLNVFHSSSVSDIAI